MKQGNHCLLDIGPQVIQRLYLAGIPPIVIILKPNSRFQLKQIIRHYYNSKSNNLMFSNKFNNSKNMLHVWWWNSINKLLFKYKNWISDCVPFETNSIELNKSWNKFNKINFSESDWITNLIDVIKHQQNLPVRFDLI